MTTPDDGALSKSEIRKLRFAKAELERKLKYAQKMDEIKAAAEQRQLDHEAADMKRRLEFSQSMAAIKSESARAKAESAAKLEAANQERQAKEERQRTERELAKTAKAQADLERAEKTKAESAAKQEAANQERQAKEELQKTERELAKTAKAQADLERAEKTKAESAAKQEAANQERQSKAQADLERSEKSKAVKASGKPVPTVKASPAPVLKASKLRTPNFSTPTACSSCHSGEHLRKWTGIVDSQTSASETKGTAVTDRGLFKNDYVTTIRSETVTKSSLASRYQKPKEPTTFLWLGYVSSIGGTALSFSSSPSLLWASLPIGAIAVAVSFSRTRKQKVQDNLQKYYDAVATYENTWYCMKCDKLFSVTR